jgi:tetratricopeptide (TPR) repeat protein
MTRARGTSAAGLIAELKDWLGMARTAAAGFWSLGRACARTPRRRLGGLSLFSFAVALILTGLAFSTACRAEEPVKGEAMFSAAGGFARLVLKLDEDVGSEVITAGSIIVIRFKQPVDIAVDKIADAVPDYIGSARRDPDGSAIRLSLTRRVTINTMTAGERVFVDLLPDSWVGPPPGLPAEVVRELSERARAAERALRQQRMAAAAKKRPPIRVRASMQPTFVRFVFEMPDGVGVSSVLNDQKLTLSFSTALNFDLADAKVAAPPNVASIDQKTDGESSAVEIVLIGEVDVHSFREDKNYIVDVGFQRSGKAAALAPPATNAALASAPTMPAPVPAPPPPNAQAGAAKPAEEQVSRQPGENMPLASEKPARQASVEIKPEQPPKISPAPETAKPEPPSNEGHPLKEMPANEMPAPSAEMPSNISPAPAEPRADIKAGENAAAVVAERSSDRLSLTFPIAAATPGALFRRADTVWLVFDSTKPFDVEPIRSKGGSIIADVSRLPLEKGQAIRIRLNRPQLPALTGGDPAGGLNWTLTFADTMQAPTQPLVAVRNIIDPAFANVSVPLARPGLLHRLVDPDAGDTLLVITAPPPVRGFIKRQDFVEFSLLESIHGVAIRPNSDDVTTEAAADRIVLGRPGGLTLSPADASAERATTAVRPLFDPGAWQKDRSEGFTAREDELIEALAAAGPDQRMLARLDLARFYMGREMFPEAKGVLDLVLADSKSGPDETVAIVMHSVANILMGHPEQGLKDLANPAIGPHYDSQLWKALAYTRQGKWADAREKFKNAEFAIPSLPVELQAIVESEAMRASIEVKDYSGAARRASELDVIGVPAELQPSVAVLRGRLAEGLGHDKDALDEYGTAIKSSDLAAASEARLFQLALRQKRDEIAQADLLRELETLSVIWRGDGVEVMTLQMMARIYIDAGRYNEAFATFRTSTRLQPNSEASRQGQDAASALFAQLFLSPKGDDLPPIDALALFYEYRELTPIGRRGDEMIRRLADRLVAVDLLDQACELLQYQVDRRLEGSARAQVAARLAMVYLMNHKPDRAIGALRTTRIADLSGELRQQRLLLEARAQSDVGRHDLGLDIISNIPGREAIRLRSDIYWASRQWRESAEQIELYYADRWRDFKPLDPVEKGDVIRAVVGYALAEDSIGLARFREKYAPLMSREADRSAFEIASDPVAVNSGAFAQIAKMAASVDTLNGFLREMKTRFPDATARAPLPDSAKSDPLPTGSLPGIVGTKRAEAAR